jgi:MFS family permease
MVLSFGQLIDVTMSFLRQHRVAMLVGAFFFSVLLLLAQAVVWHVEEEVRNTMIPGYTQDMQRHKSRIDGLQQRVRRGEMAARTALEREIHAMQELREQALDDLAPGALPPFIVLAGIVGYLMIVLLGLASSAYYLLHAARGERHVWPTVAAVPLFILPMLGVSIWSVLRSYAWVPVVAIVFLPFSPLLSTVLMITGMVLMILTVPRLAFAPVILAREEKGVMESVRLSIKRSRGYWWKIVSNFVLFAVLIWVTGALLFVVLGMIIATLGGMVAMVMNLPGIVAFTVIEWGVLGVVLFVGNFLTGVAIVFQVQLADTVMRHPRHAPLPAPKPAAHIHPVVKKVSSKRPAAKKKKR